MRILKLKEKFQIEALETTDILKVQEFELTINPGRLTYGDIIKDLETIHSLDALSFSDDWLHELIHESRNSFLEKKYGQREKAHLFFLKKGLSLINGSPVFDYIGLYQVTYWPDGQIVSSEGPNDNYLLESWQQGKPKYENHTYSFITIDP